MSNQNIDANWVASARRRLKAVSMQAEPLESGPEKLQDRLPCVDR